MAKRTLTKIALVMLISALHTPVTGQSNPVTISGTVADSSSNMIPGVTITLLNVEANSQWTTLTDAKGAYQCSGLQPGTYDLKASLTGFQAMTITNVKADAGQKYRMNFRMQIGPSAQAPADYRTPAGNPPTVRKCS